MTVEIGLGEAFVQSVLDGQFDSELDSISEAVGQRRRSIAVAVSSGIRVGDRVQVNGRASPKYLRGHKGTVLEKDSKYIKIKIDSEFYTGRYSHTLRMPPSTLERLGEGEGEGE